MSFEPEEVAMFLGMALGMGEEMAEVERQGLEAEQDHYEKDLSDFDSNDYDPDLDRFEKIQKKLKGRVKRRPFEQYVDDICKGKKTLDDPLFGPPKTKTKKKQTDIHTRTKIHGVLIEGAHLVPENFFNFIHVVLSYCKNHQLNSIVFNGTGGPVVDNNEVFGTFDARTRSITINLRSHFYNAIHTTELGHTNFSIYATIWSSMTSVFLHEIWHALDTVEDSMLKYPENKDPEDIARGWSQEMKTILATRESIEPPDLFEDPFFGPLIIKYMNTVLSSGKYSWGEHQRSMLINGTYYYNLQEGIKIKTIKEFYTLSVQGLEKKGKGRRLNECVLREIELEKKYWDEELLIEKAVLEAVKNQFALKIDYIQPDGIIARNVHVIPKKLYIKDSYGFFDAVLISESNREAIFRTDRVKRLAFCPRF